MSKHLSKIGYLPMSADLFHVGHFNAIRQAVGECDDLIIGLLTDTAMQKYKGGSIIPFEQRFEILQIMSFYFYSKQIIICPQHSLDFSENILKYNVNKIFSGDGWCDEELLAFSNLQRDLLKQGKEIQLVKLEYDLRQSTSKIKRKIIELYKKNKLIISS